MLILVDEFSSLHFTSPPFANRPLGKVAFGALRQCWSTLAGHCSKFNDNGQPVKFVIIMLLCINNICQLTSAHRGVIVSSMGISSKLASSCGKGHLRGVRVSDSNPSVELARCASQVESDESETVYCPVY